MRVGERTRVVSTLPRKPSPPRGVHSSGRLGFRVANEGGQRLVRSEANDHMHVITQDRLRENMNGIPIRGRQNRPSHYARILSLHCSLAAPSVPRDVREQTELPMPGLRHRSPWVDRHRGHAAGFMTYLVAMLRHTTSTTLRRDGPP